MARSRATRRIENAAHRLGFRLVAGVDEVDRGCLAGPVMAGAVILDPSRPVPGVNDSKLVAPAARDRLDERIRASAIAWAVAVVDPAEIDRINIHQATLKAMRLAVASLVPLPDLVLVDAFAIPGLWMAQRAIVGGDRRSAAIAAASIVAKVARDRLMGELHREDPRYGFDRHKGYGTPEHLAALVRHGYSAAHRRTFRPVSLLDMLDPGGAASPHVRP